MRASVAWILTKNTIVARRDGASALQAEMAHQLSKQYARGNVGVVVVPLRWRVMTKRAAWSRVAPSTLAPRAKP